MKKVLFIIVLIVLIVLYYFLIYKKIQPANMVNPNLNNEDKEIDMMLNSFPIINDNLRANILLSVEIYKKINNFEMTYVHEIIDEKTKKNI